MDNVTGRRFHQDRTLPTNGEIFVFGSNLAGIHGAGAALVAKQKFGAKTGLCIGYMYHSPTRSCYAIPTKDMNINTLPLREIKRHVDDFRMFAMRVPDKSFFVTRVGCGLAGYQDWEIAPMFSGCTENVIFPEEWHEYIE